MTTDQKEKSRSLSELREAAESFVERPCALSALQTRALLTELCSDLGHCLAPSDFASVGSDPPSNPRAFAELVLKLAGAATDDPEVFSPVLERVLLTFEAAARAKRRSVAPIRPEAPELRVMATVGGLVDEVRVSVTIYSDGLEPEKLSELLGCTPTLAHRKGERKHDGSAPFRFGAWILTEEGTTPQTVDQVLRRLLLRLPDDPELWSKIADDNDVQLRFGIHMTGWNKGFTISADALARLSRMRLSFDFDLYAYEPEAG
jgi:hypothetical protein